MEGHGSNPSVGDWNKTYNRRRPILYTAEDIHLKYTPGKQQELISSFLSDKPNRQLDPPDTFWYSSLRRFLSAADIRVLQRSSPLISHPNEVILLDDRKDPNGDVISTRVWDSNDNPGYIGYSPKGEVRFSKALSIKELGVTLMESVSDRSFSPCL